MHNSGENTGTDLLFLYVDAVVDHSITVGDDKDPGGGGEHQEGAGVTAVVVLCRGVHGEGRGRGTPPGNATEGGPVDITGVSEKEDRVGPDAESNHCVLECTAVERRDVKRYCIAPYFEEQNLSQFRCSEHFTEI